MTQDMTKEQKKQRLAYEFDNEFSNRRHAGYG